MPAGIQPETELTYGFMFERTAKQLKRYFQQVLRGAAAGITVDQWVVLYELHNEGGLNQFDIAQRTFKHAPTLTRLIESLDKLGLISRQQDDEDRRKYIIRLSQSGMAKVEQLLPTVMAFRKKGWQGLKTEDLENLDRIVNKIFQNLSQEESYS